MTTKCIPNLDLACKLIAEQFPAFSDLSITNVAKQVPQNRAYGLGSDILIREVCM